ncbi:CMP-N,N'-diacetyllegionaminic acid synthase [Andreesenia angusta]|uniref:CMP-N,N'-diacetyllegionaminic acid synthase n=1 Tax=Andreesenia angusta TaxID=39480 RepID=A0A1S1V755_9FIRM|nr:acylneuraminate cytidylyltransferase family protein [Andreesenia angusta]OHW61977.1 CMP-N,N'-diacetyllegionaminic acid synthase [Andreesenia angusta]
MIKDKSILCIVPARGGSKGIPNKNLKSLLGKPLIAHTIEESLRSVYIDRIIVSTDSEEIGKVSTEYGAEVPFLRPNELAKDDTPGIAPVVHVINWIKENESIAYDYVCLLQCTSPLRRIEQVDEAIERIVGGGEDTLVSVCESKENPYWMKEIKDGYLEEFIVQENQYTRRQDIPKTYSLNGAIYIGKTKTILKEGNFLLDKTIAFIMDRASSVDIDDMLDFKFVEMLMEETR